MSKILRKKTQEELNIQLITDVSVLKVLVAKLQDELERHHHTYGVGDPSILGGRIYKASTSKAVIKDE
jgi:hypothetical protein